MYLFGCLPILLLFFGFAILMQIVRFAGTTLESIGAGAVWLWESFLNLFRTNKKEVINPFNGKSNFDELRQDDDLAYHPTEIPPKIYDETDGEVTSFTEL